MIRTHKMWHTFNKQNPYKLTYIAAYILGFRKNKSQSYLVLKLHQIILIDVSRVSFLKQTHFQLLLHVNINIFL